MYLCDSGYHVHILPKSIAFYEYQIMFVVFFSVKMAMKRIFAYNTVYSSYFCWQCNFSAYKCYFYHGLFLFLETVENDDKTKNTCSKSIIIQKLSIWLRFGCFNSLYRTQKKKWKKNNKIKQVQQSNIVIALCQHENVQTFLLWKSEVNILQCEENPFYVIFIIRYTIFTGLNRKIYVFHTTFSFSLHWTQVI